MADSKTIAVLVLLLVVAFGGGINYILEKTSLGTAASSTFSNPTGFVTKYFSDKNSKELRVYAELKFDKKPELSVKVSDPMKTFSVDYTDEKATIALGTFSVNSPSPVQMEFREYTGSVSVVSDILSFAGTAGQVKYNSQYLNQQASTKVKGDAIKVTRTELTGIPRTAFTLSNMTGTITITDGASKMVYSASDADLDFGVFRGKISLEGTSLVLDGTGIFRSGMLLVPGTK